MPVQLFLVHIRVGTDYVDYDLQRYVLLLHYKKEELIWLKISFYPFKYKPTHRFLGMDKTA